MTYLIVIIPFLAVSIAVFALAARRVGAAPMAVRSAITAGVLMVLTVVFDNLMIAADLFDYPAGGITEVRIGLMPIEDLSYPLVAALSLPALSALIDTRRDSEEVTT